MSGNKCWPAWAERSGMATGALMVGLVLVVAPVLVAVQGELRDSAPVERNPWATCLSIVTSLSVWSCSL